MSYADVSLAASSTSAISTPVTANTTFNFASAGARGDLTTVENNPILPSTATSTKATGGNAVSDTQVPIAGQSTSSPPGQNWPLLIGIIAGAGVVFYSLRKFL